MSQSKSQHEADRWWLTASEDLEAAKILYTAGKSSHACFLAQQSAEKAMKALWFAADHDPWGHSIQKLVLDYPQQHRLQPLNDWITHAAHLDKFYIPARYPNGLPDLTPGQVYTSPDAEQAIGEANFFLEQTRKLIKGK
jgi:HEPN domain-containing protein